MNNNLEKDTAKRLAFRIANINAMWQEWLISMGALTLVVGLSFVIPKSILPAVVLVIGLLLEGYVGRTRERKMLRCVRITSFTSKSLLISAVVMVICIIAVRSGWVEGIGHGRPVNLQIPYISALIVFPSAFLVTAFGYLRLGKSRNCRDCKTRLGYSPQDSFLGIVFHSEALNQLKLMLWISGGLSLAGWIYYYVGYSNASINGADKYVFLIIPGVVFVISLFVTGARCHELIRSAKDVYARGVTLPDSVTELRFLILRDDSLLLHADVSDEMLAMPLSADDPYHPGIDTPAIAFLPYTTDVSEEEARKTFERISGLKGDFILRPLYRHVPVDKHSIVFHYVVILPDEAKLPETWAFNGDLWASLDKIDRLWRMGAISGALAAEIHRIFTVTMAWKTYTREGFRLYPIKNYHPTFRLRDFKNWDVDYEDPVWLTVANYNQDKAFFRLNRLVRRITGFGLKKPASDADKA